MKKEIKNRWKYRLGKLMGVMLAATTLGGSIGAKTLADFQTETYETSEFKNEITSEAESDKAAESVKSAETETETESSETSEVTGTSEAIQTP